MHLTLPGGVAVLVATSERTELLKTRALPSIAQQSLTPTRLIVVDDSGDAGASRNQKLVRDWRSAGVDVAFLRNRRTKGAAGAWNSGLDHLLHTGDDPRHLYVAFLDDDEWARNHLQRCLEAAEKRCLDVIASSFWRIEEGTEPSLVTPPESLEASSFLVGNPGIQCSNMERALGACPKRRSCGWRVAVVFGTQASTYSSDCGNDCRRGATRRRGWSARGPSQAGKRSRPVWP